MSCLVGLLTVTVWTACFRFPIVWQRTGLGVLWVVPAIGVTTGTFWRPWSILPWLGQGRHPQPFPRFTPVTTWLLYAVLWFEGLGALAVNLVVIPSVPRAANGLMYAILTGQQLLTWMLVACLLRWIFADVVTRARRLFQETKPRLALAT